MGVKTLFALAAFLLLLPALGRAVSVGVSPAHISFPEVLRGGYAEDKVTVSTDSDAAVYASYLVEGEIAPWIRIEPTEPHFNMSAQAPLVAKIIVEVPEDTMNGNYTGRVIFETEGLASPIGRVGSVVIAQVSLQIAIEVTGKERVSCKAGGFTVEDTELGDALRIKYTVRNTGNVRLAPTLAVNIWDQNQEELLISRRVTGNVILPTTSQEVTATLDDSLGIGQYWVLAKAEDCGVEDLMTLSIYERGTLLDKGVLDSISSKVWAAVNETVPISAAFRNIGSRTVSAQFKGQVLLNDKVIQAIQSEQLDVAPGSTAELTTLFSPPNPGKYLITGRVIYNKKLSFEKGNVLNVYQEPTAAEKKTNIGPLVLYLVIITTILFLVRRIAAIKRGRRKKW